MPQVEQQWHPPLRGVRESQGRGLHELCRSTGLDPAQVSRIERGLSGLSVHTLLKIARELHLDELTRFLKPWVRPVS